MTTKKINLLILGDGYIGKNLYEHLKKDFNILIKSRKDLNYHDIKELGRFILNNEILTIINCSGFTGRPNIDEAEIKKELCWELNVEVPLEINRLCNQLGVNYLHISSGCIYEGYEKEWTEEDESNYGLFTNHSSFYSKSKHAFERMSKKMKGIVLRIRMPFHHDSCHRNYLEKIRNYNNLINFQNSKTYIPDLCEFVKNILIKKPSIWSGRETYNVVNPCALYTNEVCDIMRHWGFHNNNWQFVNMASLHILTSRSNCVLDSRKSEEIYKMKTEREALEECFSIKTKQSEEHREKLIEGLEEERSYR